MAETPTSVFLGEFETKALLDLEVRPAGTYIVKMMVRCNSLLSSVFIKAAGGGTVKVNYFDTTTGDTNSSERFDLDSHVLQSASGVTDRILVSRIHNKPHLEVIVTGGPVEFGVYVTAVTSSASDLDTNLVFDAEAFFTSQNKGLPAVTLDDSENKLYFLRSNQGKLTIEQDFGTINPLRGSNMVAALATVVLTSAVVPVGKVWRLRRLEGQCRAHGFFEVFVDALLVAKTNSSAACENSKFSFDPFGEAVAGETVEVHYTNSHGPTVPVTSFLFTTEATA